MTRKFFAGAETRPLNTGEQSIRAVRGDPKSMSDQLASGPAGWQLSSAARSPGRAVVRSGAAGQVEQAAPPGHAAFHPCLARPDFDRCGGSRDAEPVRGAVVARLRFQAAPSAATGRPCPCTWRHARLARGQRVNLLIADRSWPARVAAGPDAVSCGPKARMQGGAAMPRMTAARPRSRLCSRRASTPCSSCRACRTTLFSRAVRGDGARLR